MMKMWIVLLLLAAFAASAQSCKLFQVLSAKTVFMHQCIYLFECLCLFFAFVHVECFCLHCRNSSYDSFVIEEKARLYLIEFN